MAELEPWTITIEPDDSGWLLCEIFYGGVQRTAHRMFCRLLWGDDYRIYNQFQEPMLRVNLPRLDNAANGLPPCPACGADAESVYERHNPPGGDPHVVIGYRCTRCPIQCTKSYRPNTGEEISARMAVDDAWYHRDLGRRYGYSGCTRATGSLNP